MDMNNSNLNQGGFIWAPCIPNYSTGCFIPIYNLTTLPNNTPNAAASLPRGGIKTKPWSHEEDQALRSLTQAFGPKKWAKVAKQLNNQFNQGRIGKNCRERWNNHMNPEINKGQWSYQEDLTLLTEYKKKGRKWSSISKILSGRTENSVKNRWGTLMKSFQQTGGSKNYEMATEFLIVHLTEIIRNGLQS